jgi:hypothetical protein
MFNSNAGGFKKRLAKLREIYHEESKAEYHRSEYEGHLSFHVTNLRT